MELTQLLETEARCRIVFQSAEHRFQLAPEGPLGADKFVQVDDHSGGPCCLASDAAFGWRLGLRSRAKSKIIIVARLTIKVARERKAWLLNAPISSVVSMLFSSGLLAKTAASGGSPKSAIAPFRKPCGSGAEN